MMKESPVAAVAESSAKSDAAANAAGTVDDPAKTDPTESVAAANADEVMAEVAKVIAAIRPAVQADKGDIELISVDMETGIVEVELQGACTSCPASSATLKSGVERIMKDRVPGITEVVNVGQVFYSDGTAVTL